MANSPTRKRKATQSPRRAPKAKAPAKKRKALTQEQDNAARATMFKAVLACGVNMKCVSAAEDAYTAIAGKPQVETKRVGTLTVGPHARVYLQATSGTDVPATSGQWVVHQFTKDYLWLGVRTIGIAIVPATRKQAPTLDGGNVIDSLDVDGGSVIVSACPLSDEQTEKLENVYLSTNAVATPRIRSAFIFSTGFGDGSYGVMRHKDGSISMRFIDAKDE